MSKVDEKLRKEAQKALARGDYGEALAAYQQLLQQDPTDAKLWVTVGDICVKLNQPKQAAQIYEKAAQQYSVAWELPQAIQLNQRILALDPGNEKAKKQLKLLASRLEIQKAAKRNADTVHRWHAERAEQGHGGGFGGIPLATDNDRPFTTADRNIFDPSAVSFSGEREKADAGGSQLESWITRGSPAPKSGASDARALTLTNELTQRIMAQDANVDRRQAALKEVAAQLPDFDLFQGLPGSAFTNLLGHFDLHRLDAGAVIVSEGDEGDSVYLVARGAARMIKRDWRGRPVELATLVQGEFFGEDAFLNDAIRSYGVTVAGDAVVLEITRDALDLLIRKHAEIGERLETNFRRRIVNAALSTSALFSPLGDAQRRALLKHCEPATHPAATRIFEQGAAPTHVFLVVSGRVQLDRNGRKIVDIKEGETAGEVEVLGNRTALTTATTATRTRLLQMPREIFGKLMEQAPEVRAAIQSVAEKRLSLLVGV